MFSNQNYDGMNEVTFFATTIFHSGGNIDYKQVSQFISVLKFTLFPACMYRLHAFF